VGVAWCIRMSSGGTVSLQFFLLVLSLSFFCYFILCSFPSIPTSSLRFIFSASRPITSSSPHMIPSHDLHPVHTYHSAASLFPPFFPYVQRVVFSPDFETRKTQDSSTLFSYSVIHHGPASRYTHVLPDSHLYVTLLIPVRDIPSLCAQSLVLHLPAIRK
jgi:hypothetical protein